MSKRTFVVVADDDPAVFDLLRESIEDHGFEIETALEPMGIFVGSIDDGDVDVIKHLAGVESVTEEMTVYIPSPDSEGPF